MGEVPKEQMKVFSFSVFGDDPVYTIGVIKNIALIKEFFPDWKAHIYLPHNQNSDYVKRINEYDNTVITLMEDQGSFNRAWRFMSISEDWVDVMVSRDADSRISMRDRVAIDEWLASSYNYNIIRDHPGGHHWAINAGMWGAKKTEFIKHIDQMLEECKRRLPYVMPTFDQEFLRAVIYPMIVKESMVHDEYYKYEPQAKPIDYDRKLTDFAFIGESIDENDIPRGEQRAPIKEIYYKK